MPLDRIHEIEARIVERRTKIDEWLHGRSRDVKIPFYASTDLRNAGYKISVVDTNLFPAGFNILCGKFFDHQTDAARRFIEARFGAVSRVLILPEAHTRNAGYVDNIRALQNIIASAGYEVRLGLLAESRDKTVDVRGTQGDVQVLHALQRQGDVLSANDFTPDLILLNNDMTDGPPDILRGLSQPVTPPVEMGWHNRRKNVYFDVLHRLTDEFAALLDLDPWWLTTVTDIEKGVDFQSGEGMDRLAERTEKVLERVRAQYRDHKIDEKPYVFIKHNTGTYGMGVIAVDSAEELLHLNRRMRQKMRSGKGNMPVTDVLIQEGVPSTDIINDCTGEPVMYLIGLDLIGGFFRQHCGKSERENLNQSGATFARLCFRGEDAEAPSDQCYRDTCLRTVYGVLAQVAVLAAGHEIEQMAPRTA